MRILPRKIRVRTAILIALSLMLTLSLFFAITFFSIRSSLIARSESEAMEQLRSVLTELNAQKDATALEQIVSRHAVTGESRLVYVILDRSHDSVRLIYPAAESFNPSAIPRNIIQQMITAPRE